MCGMVRLIETKYCSVGRNYHNTLTSPLSVCLAKLSIVGLSENNGEVPYCNTECGYLFPWNIKVHG